MLIRLERDGDHVCLITRGGYDWINRFPWIVESVLKNRHQHFVIDGDAVVLGVDGIADFSALDSMKSTRRHWRNRLRLLTSRGGLLMFTVHPERA